MLTDNLKPDRNLVRPRTSVLPHDRHLTMSRLPERILQTWSLAEGNPSAQKRLDTTHLKDSSLVEDASIGSSGYGSGVHRVCPLKHAWILPTPEQPVSHSVIEQGLTQWQSISICYQSTCGLDKRLYRLLLYLQVPARTIALTRSFASRSKLRNTACTTPFIPTLVVGRAIRSMSRNIRIS